MEAINQTVAQLTDLFRSMSPGSRITAGLLLVVVVVSLGYLFTGQIASPDTDLMNGEPVPPAMIPAMEAAFEGAGLKSYEIRGTQIRVPRGQKPSYMAALAAAGALPPNIHTVFKESLGDRGPFTSNADRKDSKQVAKQTFLGMVISKMPGIQSAFVTYETKKKGGLMKEEVTTAAVTVTPTASDQLTNKQVSTIRHLVASAINTPPGNVTIADMAGSNYYIDLEGDGSGENKFSTLTRMHTEDFRKKVLKVLNKVPGVDVAVTVQLNTEKSWIETDTTYNPKPVTISQTTESLSESSETPGPAGRPGVASQGGGMAGPMSVGASFAKGSTTSTEGEKSESHSIADVARKSIEKEGLTPRRVTVSVAVPSSYFEKIWHQRNPAEEGQEPKTPDEAELATIRSTEETAIKDAIAILLPPAEGVDDRTDLVQVTTFEALRPDELPEPGMSENAMTWFAQYWSTVGMIGLAGFSLVMLRSMVRSTAPEPELSGPRLASIEGEETAVDEEDDLESRLSRFSGSGRSLRDELSELVKEDPDAAANILKGWIGSAG